MRRLAVVALALAAACTSTPTAVPTSPAPTPTPVESPTPTATPTPTARPVPSFEAARAYATIVTLVKRAPRREAASAAYKVAAGIVADRFEQLGYRVRRQSFSVPAGTCDRIAVAGGTSQNVIAEPPGYDPAKPHLLVGGHLDTVPDTPGANDDASGPAVILELARLARLQHTKLPIVWVAFGAEERRKGKGFNVYSLGSRAYLRGMSAAEHRSLVGMVNVDMVGHGPDVQIIGGQGPMVSALVSAARRMGVARQVHATITGGFSDHVQFQNAGYSVGWLWAGDSPTLHTPRDRLDVIQLAELRRIGVVAWQMLRSYHR